MHDFPAILAEILATHALPAWGIHGVAHWSRVAEAGALLAAATGADAEVVELFALFHDSRRLDDGNDPGHGLRGGEFARSLRGRLVHLSDDRFELLFEACRLHTDGRTTGDPTLLACWDADRLDLWRVGITPARHRLCTGAARGLVGWSWGRFAEGGAWGQALDRWGYTGAISPGV